MFLKYLLCTYNDFIYVLKKTRNRNKKLDFVVSKISSQFEKRFLKMGKER